MRRVFSLGVAVIAGLLVITGCFSASALSSVVHFHPHETIVGSGNLVVESYGFENFDSVSSNHAFHVEINQSNQFSVELEIDDNVLQYFEIDQFGNRLRFELDSDLNMDMKDVTMRVRISMPAIRSIEGNVVSRFELTGFDNQGAVDIELSAASSLTGDLEATDLRVDINAASSLNLTGSANNLDLHASGASSANLYEFPVVNADVHVSGASSARVDVSGRLDAEAHGVSSIFYRGSPELGRMISTGFSSIIHQD